MVQRMHPPAPRSVIVGPFRYTISRNRAAIAAAAKERGEELEGCLQAHKLLLLVSPDMPEERQAEAMLHELLHAICDATGLTVPLGHKAEERVVAAMSPALLDMLRRNPKLVAYLLAT